MCVSAGADGHVFLGDADGLGETRKKELIKSGMQLGLKEEDDVFVIDNPYVDKLWTVQ